MARASASTPHSDRGPPAGGGRSGSPSPPPRVLSAPGLGGTPHCAVTRHLFSCHGPGGPCIVGPGPPAPETPACPDAGTVLGHLAQWSHHKPGEGEGTRQTCRPPPAALLPLGPCAPIWSPLRAVVATLSPVALSPASSQPSHPDSCLSSTSGGERMSPQNRGEAWGDRASQPGAVGEVAETHVTEPPLPASDETPRRDAPFPGAGGAGVSLAGGGCGVASGAYKNVTLLTMLPSLGAPCWLQAQARFLCSMTPSQPRKPLQVWSELGNKLRLDSGPRGTRGDRARKGGEQRGPGTAGASCPGPWPPLSEPEARPRPSWQPLGKCGRLVGGGARISG